MYCDAEINWANASWPECRQLARSALNSQLYPECNVDEYLQLIKLIILVEFRYLENYIHIATRNRIVFNNSFRHYSVTFPGMKFMKNTLDEYA